MQIYLNVCIEQGEDENSMKIELCMAGETERMIARLAPPHLKCFVLVHLFGCEPECGGGGVHHLLLLLGPLQLLAVL